MAAAELATSAAFPLRVSANRRYLEDQDGKPFLVVGDAAWSLIAGTTKADVMRYLIDRKTKGFTALNIVVLRQNWSYDAPRNWFGDEPFETPGDFASPNEAYFAYADWVLDRTAELGFLVQLSVCWLGYRSPRPVAAVAADRGPRPPHASRDLRGSSPRAQEFESDYGPTAVGWFAEILENGVDKCEAFGRYLGRRWASRSNILWSLAGDRNPGATLEHVLAMQRGIAAEDGGGHLFAALLAPEAKLEDGFPVVPEWIDVNYTYSYGIVHQALLEDYNATPTRPSILVESTFENEHNASTLQIRRQAYWAMLCGACGQFLGTLPIWAFMPGWEGSLDSPGSVAMSHLSALFSDLPWWELVPDQEHSFVVDGLGEFRGLDYCSAARTPDGRLGVAYVPTARTIVVDLGQLAGPELRAIWFDPIRGTRLEPSRLAAEGLHAFSSPTDQDWVLMLELEDKDNGGG